MKKPFFSPPADVLMHALTTLLAGLGCVLPLAMAMGLTATHALMLGTCAAVTLLFSLLDCVPRLRSLAYPLLLAALFALAMRYAGRWQAVATALTLFLNGQTLALAAYSRAVTVLLCLLFTGMVASLSRSGHAFFPLAFLLIVLLFVVSFLGADVSPMALLPLLTALLLSGRAQGVRTPRILPCAAIVLAVTLLCMPLAGSTYDPLAAFARRMQRAIGDYLFFTDARTTFSLSSAGWQPLGADQLGGAVSPTDEPVMQVYTTGRTLLRGTVKNAYNSHAWSDTTDQRRYLFVSPRFSALRRELFDLDRPGDALRERLIAYEPMIVSMRASSASTLYLTQRFTSPTGEDIVAYFSPATEVFATRSLEVDSRYTFTGSRLTGASEGVREAVLSCMSASDPYLGGIQERYLALPEGLDSATLFLAQQITAQETNDFDRAGALCAYLQRHFPYTLNQSTPPPGRDFVSWFLFEEQKGYCTSFASALAVLGRAIGLPTRYVEGYAAEPDADNVARVTQQNAHAWVEIYFNGFGWLAFDPTPGTGFAPDGAEDDENGPDDGDNDDSNGGASPDVTPTPTPTPTPEPTPTPSPTPEHNDPSVTPTPEITPAPTPTPTPEPTPAPPKRDDDPPAPPPIGLIPLLILLLILFVVALRLWLCSPAHLAQKPRRANDRLLVWYAACAQALTAMGIPSMGGEAPASYMERAQSKLGGKPALTALGKAVCISRYSPYNLARVQVEKAERTYRALLARMNPLQKARMFASRLIHGLKA